MSKLHVDATLAVANRMAELQAENERLKERIGDLEQNLRVAESVRDDARAAIQEDGEDPCLAHTFVGDVCRDCGLVAPRHVDGVRQCPWILDDEDPDEGYWHCKHPADHVGIHETEFGKGREPVGRWVRPMGIDRRWKTRGSLPPSEPSAATEAELDSLYAYARDRLDPNRPRDLLDQLNALGYAGPVSVTELDRDEHSIRYIVDGLQTRDIPMDDDECACSPKYCELAPGVHANYCPLRGKPLETT